MKKIIFVIVFLSTLSLNAQHAWRVGDTVQGRYTRDTDYFYQWWCDSVDRDAPLLLISDFLSTVQCLEALMARWSLLSGYTH